MINPMDLSNGQNRRFVVNAPVLGALLVLVGCLAPPALTRQSTPSAPQHQGNTRAPGPRVHALQITVLSTMLADAGIGEWGFAALIDVDGHRILFDTGAHPDTVRMNAQELGIDLSGVEDVVLSHFHSDHTAGLVTLRQTLAGRSPAALSRAHVGQGFFWSRPDTRGELNQMIAERSRYEAIGGTFIEEAELRQLHPGVWLTGAVPRVHPERNWGPAGKVRTPNGISEDFIPEDLSLVVDTDEGLVVVSGCGHAGIINTLEFAQARIRRAPIYAAVGGFHLFELDDARLNWTADHLRRLGVVNLLGGHCTGIEAVYRIRQRSRLTRKSCVVSAVGSSFTLGKGIDPKDVAR